VVLDKICSICFVEVEGFGIRELPCGCKIHEECFKGLLNNAVQSLSYPLVCPYAQCGSLMDLGYLAEILTMEELTPIHDLAFWHYTTTDNSIVRCPGQCGYLVSWDPKSECKEIDCPICNNQFCSVCKLVNGHVGECDPIPSNYKQCKLCGSFIERYEGCDNVTCRCGYQFCWKCMSPKGGCQCSPGHGYYAVAKVISNWSGFSKYYVCQCQGTICTCK